MARDHTPEQRWTVKVIGPQPTDHLLELGFGPGVAIELLSRCVPHGRVSGIDYAPTMVNAARRRNRVALRNGRVDLRCGDVTTLPFPDASFDTVFGIHTIYFWPQPQRVLQEVLRVVRPGGRIVLTVLPKERWNEHDPSMAVGTPECRPYSGSELHHMLVTAGFVAPSIEADTDVQYRSNYSIIAVKDKAREKTAGQSRCWN